MVLLPIFFVIHITLQLTICFPSLYNCIDLIQSTVVCVCEGTHEDAVRITVDSSKDYSMTNGKPGDKSSRGP